MNSEVKVLYDFSAQPGSGELTITTGEILRVTRTDVGDGWWEGINSRGMSGLFPEGYVEPLSLAPAMATGTEDVGNEEYWPEDDWDDDDSQTSASMHDLSQQQSNTQRGSISKPVVKKSYNRFSTFVKSGGEDYILGSKNKIVPSEGQVSVVEENGVIKWAPNQHPYSCQVASPSKEAKFKGLKSYIAYKITPSFNSIQVSRRYKHFDWLQGRLEMKFINIPIPPLPDKQISGRYQDDFIRHRLAQLQLWVDRICRHPVLSQSEVWMHFMTCTDERRWKQGKRTAERDEFVGASFFYAIQTPEQSLDIDAIDKQTDQFVRFTGKMDEAVKHLYSTAQDQAKKYAGPYKREFTRISAAFSQLADSFNSGAPSHTDEALNSAILHTARTYESIGKMYEEQPKLDFEPMSDVLHEYKGILANWPDILQLHQGAIKKKREHKKLQDEGKVDAALCQSVFKRADTVSYATLAEVDYFQTQRNIEFKCMMQNFLKGQIDFFQNITDTLRQTLQQYES